MLLDQQVHLVKLVGVTNRWDTHKRISDDPVERVQNNHGAILI